MLELSRDELRLLTDAEQLNHAVETVASTGHMAVHSDGVSLPHQRSNDIPRLLAVGRSSSVNVLGRTDVTRVTVVPAGREAITVVASRSIDPKGVTTYDAKEIAFEDKQVAQSELFGEVVPAHTVRIETPEPVSVNAASAVHALAGHLRTQEALQDLSELSRTVIDIREPQRVDLT